MNDSDFEAYAEKYSDTIYRIAFNYLKNRSDSEDVLQNVLIRFYRSRDKLVNDRHIKAWLIRVAVNESKRLLAANARRGEQSLSECAGMLYPDDTDSRELFSEVMRLPQKYRDVLYLCYYEGYTAEEIAAMLHKSPSAIRSRLSRARQKLKIVLEDNDG